MASGKPWLVKNYALIRLCWTRDCSLANRYWVTQVTSLDDAITPACVLVGKTVGKRFIVKRP